MNRKVYKALAKKYGVSVDEIKRDMQEAINHAYQQPSPTAQAVKRQGEIPTVDEFMLHTVLETKKRVDEEKALNIDSTLKNMVMELLENISSSVFADEKALAEFKGKPADQLHDYHFGLGLYLRNNILTSDSVLVKSFKENGITHYDDMSSAIIRLWHTSLQ